MPVVHALLNIAFVSFGLDFIVVCFAAGNEYQITFSANLKTYLLYLKMYGKVLCAAFVFLLLNKVCTHFIHIYKRKFIIEQIGFFDKIRF